MALVKGEHHERSESFWIQREKILLPHKNNQGRSNSMTNKKNHENYQRSWYRARSGSERYYALRTGRIFHPIVWFAVVILWICIIQPMQDTLYHLRRTWEIKRNAWTQKCKTIQLSSLESFNPKKKWCVGVEIFYAKEKMVYLDVLKKFLVLKTLWQVFTVIEKYLKSMLGSSPVLHICQIISPSTEQEWWWWPLIFQHTCIWFSYFKFNLSYKVQLLHHSYVVIQFAIFTALLYIETPCFWNNRRTCAYTKENGNLVWLRNSSTY